MTKRLWGITARYLDCDERVNRFAYESIVPYLSNFNISVDPHFMPNSPTLMDVMQPFHLCEHSLLSPENRQ